MKSIINGVTSKLTGTQTVEVTGKKRLTTSSEIRTELNTFGIAQTNYFIVDFTPPKILRNTIGGEQANAIRAACAYRGSGGVLPGIQLNTSGVRRFTVGLEERNPISPIVVDQTFTFIGDGQGLVYNFFYKWINSIVTSNKSHTYHEGADYGLDYDRYPGSVLYKDQYTTTLEVFVYADGDRSRDIHHVVFDNAYPVAIGDIQLNWADNDSYIQFPITFTYTNWRSDLTFFEEDTVITGKKNSKGLLGKVASAALLVSTLRKPRNIQDILSVVNNTKTVIGGFSGVTKFGG